MKNLVIQGSEGYKNTPTNCPVKRLQLGREKPSTPILGTGDKVGATGGEKLLWGLKRARLGQADPEKHMYSILLIRENQHDQSRLDKVIQLYDATLVKIKLLISYLII